jgi:predicted TIM-barrel fold metal-dependent hydrolase
MKKKLDLIALQIDLARQKESVEYIKQYIDFAKDNIKEQVEKIRDFGFKGIKMHPAWQRFNVMCDKAQQVYAAAEELGLFVSFHTGIHWHRIKDYDIKLYDEVACTFPKLNFSMEHIGFRENHRRLPCF